MAVGIKSEVFGAPAEECTGGSDFAHWSASTLGVSRVGEKQRHPMLLAQQFAPPSLPRNDKKGRSLYEGFTLSALFLIVTPSKTHARTTTILGNELSAAHF
jgi:hypothetical protein